MKPLPRDRDLLLGLLDEIKSISAGLANETLNVEMGMKHETELREVYRGFPLHRVQDVLATRRHIIPAARAGILRLYDRKALSMVRHAINAIDARKSGRERHGN